MSNQWFRMYAEFATDAKVQMLPEHMQRRLVMLLCIRCNGDVTLHDEEIAFQLRVTSQEWADTKALFIAKNFINQANEIVNWDKRQYVSDSSTPRVRAYREKKKQGCNVSETPPDTEQNRTDTEQKDKERTSAPDEKKFVLPDWVPKEKWDGYCQMRQRIRKPMTNNAKELIVKDLSRLSTSGHDPGDVLDQSIKNSYQGVFEINKSNGGFNGTATKSSTERAADAAQRGLEAYQRQNRSV